MIKQQVQSAINGDCNSMESLIMMIKDKIFNMSLYFTGDFELAKDCTQEILIKIVTSLSQIKDETKFESWSYSIASNYLRNYKRDSKKYMGISFEAMEADTRSHLEIANTNDEAVNNIKELAYELKISCTIAMLMCLTKEDRILVIFSNIMRLDSAKIGEILNIKPEAVRKRLSRANQKTKNFINNNCGLLNKENPCNCRQRVNYAILQKRLSVGNHYFQDPDYLSDNEILINKIERMNNLEDIGDIFQNNPNYSIDKSLLKDIYEISEI